MPKEPEPIATHTLNFDYKGTSFKAVLKSYDEPIRKSEGVECYSRLEIFDGESLWGSMNFTRDNESPEEANKIFETLTDNPTLFQLK